MDIHFVISHIERHLGTIGASWTLKENENHVQVIRYPDAPIKSVATFVTLGLSHHLLAMSDTQNIRQELIFSAYQKFNEGKIASMLLTFSDFVIHRHKAILRGDIECSNEPIIPDIPLTCLYATIPTLFQDSIDVCHLTSPPTVFVWLLPLHRSEANFVKTNGWSKFEEMLEKLKADVFDLCRSPVG